MENIKEIKQEKVVSVGNTKNTSNLEFIKGEDNMNKNDMNKDNKDNKNNNDNKDKNDTVTKNISKQKEENKKVIKMGDEKMKNEIKESNNKENLKDSISSKETEAQKVVENLNNALEDTDLEERREEKTAEEILDEASKIALMDEDEQDEVRLERESKNMRLIDFLKKRESKEIMIPDCQRCFIWNDKKIKSFLETVIKNRPCGSIQLCELNNVLYLTDGLQRTTTLSILLQQAKDNKDLVKLIKNYKLMGEVIHCKTYEDVQNIFLNANDGVKVASSIVKRSKIKGELSDLLQVYEAGFLKELCDEPKAPKTYKNGGHYVFVAENVLLAGSQAGVVANQAKDLSNKLIESESKILDKQYKQRYDLIINTLKNILEGIKKKDETKVQKFCNNNFLSSLVYVIADNNINNKKYSIDNYVDMFMAIFPNKNSIKEYPTGSGTNSLNAVERRIDLMKKLLDEARNGKKENDKKEEVVNN